MKQSLAIAIFSLLSLPALSMVDCTFTGGEVVRPQGNVVSRNFVPRVVPASQIDLMARGADIVISSRMSPSLFLRGVRNCQTSRLRDGFDCYEVDDFWARRQFNVHLANRGQNTALLEAALNVPGGALQVDSYRCR
jgi:hypothetical protein